MYKKGTCCAQIKVDQLYCEDNSDNDKYHGEKEVYQQPPII